MIEDELKNLKNEYKKISVIGLGYVGLPVAIAFIINMK